MPLVVRGQLRNYPRIVGVRSVRGFTERGSREYLETLFGNPKAPVDDPGGGDGG